MGYIIFINKYIIFKYKYIYNIYTSYIYMKKQVYKKYIYSLERRDIIFTMNKTSSPIIFTQRFLSFPPLAASSRDKNLSGSHRCFMAVASNESQLFQESLQKKTNYE